MATMVGKESSLLKLLAGLIELDHDASAACDAAIARLSGQPERSTLASFRDDHRRHVGDLTVVLRSMGGKVPVAPEPEAVLTRGKVILGSLLGDEAILMAMKSNEGDTNIAYERAAARTDLPLHVRDVLNRNLADERRHRAWIEARLQVLRQQPSAR
jgi:hypothetical protein